MIHNKKTFLLLTTISLGVVTLTLSSCAPLLVIGGGAGAMNMVAKDKGVGGTINDTQISTAIKTKIYKKDQDIHRRVGVNVQNGEVLLTGSLASQDLLDDVEQIAWSVPGVKKVMNQMGISSDDSLGVGEATKDAWITTRIKSSLVFTENVMSGNYSIKTVSGVVYVMGIAQNQEELDKVLETARKVSGVKKVMSYVNIKPQLQQASADAIPKNETAAQEEDVPAVETTSSATEKQTVVKEEIAVEEDAPAE